MGIGDWIRNRVRTLDGYLRQERAAQTPAAQAPAAPVAPPPAPEPDWPAGLRGALPRDGCTQRLLESLRAARAAARDAGASETGSGHLLAGLVGTAVSAAAQLLAAQGIDRARVAARARAGAASPPASDGHAGAAPAPYGAAALRILERACSIARESGQHHLGTEHLLMALSGMEGNGAAEALRACGADPILLRKEWLEQMEADVPAHRGEPDAQVLGILREIRGDLQRITSALDEGETPARRDPPQIPASPAA